MAGLGEWTHCQFAFLVFALADQDRGVREDRVVHLFSGRARAKARRAEHRRQRGATEGLAAACSLAAARVVAHGLIRAGAAQIPALRHLPASAGGHAVPASLLRHADAQTVVGLAAVVTAMEASGLDPAQCSDWGIVAAPRFLGRVQLAGAFAQYAIDGAWGVSPHLVPHHSLHSMAGTISQALKISGPNLGAGGGREGEREAFLAATTLLAREGLPGVWLVVTGWVPELAPAATENAGAETAQAQPECRGLALGLAKLDGGGSSPCLRLCVATEEESAPTAGFDAIGLSAWLAQAGGASPEAGCASWSLGETSWIELEPAPSFALQST